MIILDKVFFKPSKESRVLAILDTLAADSRISQVELGHRTSLSGAMVNQYLRELCGKNCVRYEPANGKKFRYRLTSEGQRLRNDIFVKYSSELVRLYTDLKKSIQKQLRELQDRGIRKVVLFGASETCEVVISALRNESFEIVAIIDNNDAKHGTTFNGYVISPFSVLQTIKCDAVIVTSFGSRDEICEQLAPLASAKQMEIVRL